MSRIKSRFIIFGTSTDEVNARDLPANFTPTNYTPSEVGTEGDDKTSAHLKGIDSALGTAGANPNDIGETSFSAANNQSSPADVTGFAFNNLNVRSFKALVSVSIVATGSLFEVYELMGIQTGVGWQLSQVSTGDDSGVDFSVTTLGQVQYTSSNVTGFVSDTIKFRAWSTAV